MATYYDDNFGHWDIRDEDDREFYRQVAKRSVWKKCQGCGRKVKLMPQYGYCDSCATRREQGWDF